MKLQLATRELQLQDIVTIMRQEAAFRSFFFYCLPENSVINNPYYTLWNTQTAKVLSANHCHKTPGGVSEVDILYSQLNQVNVVKY